jgi:hypothetical protein
MPLREGNELDPLRSEGFQGSEQMAHRSGETVEFPNHDSIESPTVRVCHQPIELGTFSFVPLIPMSTYSAKILQPHRSAYSRSSRVCTVGSCPLFAVLTRA